ncbi:transglutaminase domain-containing protein [Pelagicoccus mobilis]|uniref:Transglutaminase-like domain-containing protein n=1 Tax=Pelagicoccus mobilis TaxID=415221 RepID=A0A934RY89_9BACT|nr:transglutaminase domain-containing protein [Pelagicoccus mobilis]MBK1876069.1 hypothetical protein [Pelagicoccus mobilis]
MKRPNFIRLLWTFCWVLCWLGSERCHARDLGELEAAFDRAGENGDSLRTAFEASGGEHREALRFLLENMPDADLVNLSGDYLLENIELALSARESSPWGQRVPWLLFLNYVLPYANLDETREDWRGEMRVRCLPIIDGIESPAAAAHELNRELFKKVGVKYSTKRLRPNQSPSETIEQGMASCTGLSILLVDACRSVGIPARVVGTPLWTNKRGNHTWVEIWDGQWHFAGACEASKKGLNHGWFVRDASLAQGEVPEHSIYAASFKKTETKFPMVWDRGNQMVSAENVSAFYNRFAEEKKGVRLLVDVYTREGKRRMVHDVSAYRLPEGNKIAAGTSKGKGDDTNNILEFMLPKAGAYLLVSGGYEKRVELAAGQNHIKWNLEESVPDSDGRIRRELEGYWNLSKSEKVSYAFSSEANALMRERPKRMRALVWESYQKSSAHDELKEDLEARRVRFGEHESPYFGKTVGRRPTGGWPLFIAMHGGGGAPAEVNDSQWEIMKRYYKDQPTLEGYKYLALRAPNNKWNGFYDDYVYPLVQNLVKQFLLFEDVNPDRVFLIGYSHGGYGAFSIGPKIPDRFAAIHASAAAPTDGQTSALNLRNTAFSFMIGEKDLAYDRLSRCQAFDREVRRLKGGREDIFPVTYLFKAGYPHSGLPDRDQILEMYPSRRDVVPRELSWEMTDTVVDRFFWLGVENPEKRQRVFASCKGNFLRVETVGRKEVTVFLDERLVDFGKPLTVKIDGKYKNQEVVIEPSLNVLCDSLEKRGDIRLAFSCALVVRGNRVLSQDS